LYVGTTIPRHRWHLGSDFLAQSQRAHTIGTMSLSLCKVSCRWLVIYFFLYNGSPITTKRYHLKPVHALTTSSSSRRRFVSSAVGGVLSVPTWCQIFNNNNNNSNNDPDGSSTVAVAAPPITAKETDSLLAISKRKLRRKPPKIIRRKLNQDFAVLLMRSSYNALDELDCVGMDQFQRDFFLIRSSEYESYIKALGDGLVKQGELSDPYYFDFISFAQYQAINRELTLDPLMVFEEMQLAPEEKDGEESSRSNVGRFIPVVVKRDPSMTNEKLVPTHSSKVGGTILNRFIETFAGTSSKIPNLDVLLGSGEKDPTLILEAIQQLLNLFLINGYAFGAEVNIDPSSTGSTHGTKYTITLNAPVTLWGGQVLQQENVPLNNNFVLKTVTELLNRSGYKCSSAIKYDGSKEIITVTII
jgi:hypothetical protein